MYAKFIISQSRVRFPKEQHKLRLRRLLQPDRTHTHANGNHINHTHRAALGGDFCIARNARTAAGIGVKR